MLKLLVVLLLIVGGAHANPPVRSPCPRALKINTNYQWRNSLHFICLQMRAQQQPQLDVIEYAGQRLIVSARINEMNVNQMASFVDDDGTLRVLVSVPDRINGTSMYSFDSQGAYINETFTTNTQLVSTMSVWRLELNLEWHLATANHPYVAPLMSEAARNTRKPLPEVGPIISIHSWRSSYFDRYQLVTLPADARVNKLEPMHIYDQEFLIVALESSKHDSHSRLHSNSPLKTDSMIFKLDFGDGSLNWVHYQYLGTKHALDASSFVVTHKDTLKQDYYIALVGQSEPESNSTGVSYPSQLPHTGRQTEHGLVIYKYLGDRFMETHSYPIEGATKLDTITYGVGDSYVVLVVLSDWSKQISVFLFDGLYLNKQVLRDNNRDRPYARAPPPMFTRAINSESLRLFRAPSSPTGYEKRTLDDDDMLGFAFTSLPDSSDGYTNIESDSSISAPSESANFYEIPIKELIANQTNENESHVKRDSVGDDLLGWCKAQINSILGDKFELMARRMSELPRVDQARPIKLDGDVVIEGDLHISNLLYVNRIEDNNAPNSVVSGTPPDYSQTFNNIERAHQAIDSMKQQVDQILVEDGTVQEVYTPLRFQKLIIECVDPSVQGSRLYQPAPFARQPCLQVGEIRTNLLNKHDIHDIREQALLTGRSMKVKHDVRFEHLVLRGRTNIMDTLNGIHIDDIVFRQGAFRGPIKGHKNFRSGLYSTTNLLVEDWHGLRVDQQNYLTSSGDQRIDADLRFHQVVLEGGNLYGNASSRIEMLNGLHLDTRLSQIAQADGANQFDVPVSFDEIIIQGPTSFSAGSLVSGVDIEHLWSRTMFKHSNQNITAPMEFLGDVHVSYGGDVLVDGLLNGVRLEPGNVMMRNRNYTLPNPVIFDGDLSVRALEIHKHLNGIQVLTNYQTGRPVLSILYDFGDQIISGHKIFNDIRLGGKSQVGDSINGHLNLTQLYSLARDDGRPRRFGSVSLRGQNIQVGENVHVHVGLAINGIPVDDICGLANRLTQPTSNHYNRLRFEQPVSFSSLRCASINGFNDLSRSFLTRNGDQTIAGTIKLLNGAVFNSSLSIGRTYNNLNVSSMSQAITQVINESISGHKDFYGDLYIDELTTDTINDLPLSQVFIAKSDHPQAISAPMVFDHLDIENVLVIGQDLKTRTFNGLNVSDIIANTLQYDAPQVIYNHVELDHLHILPGANLVTNSLNGRDLRQVYADSVLVDTPQQILAPKTFSAPVRFTDRVYPHYGIDSLPTSELKFNLLLQGDELIEDDLEFNNDVTIMRALEVQTGLINDIDVNSFVSSMISENRPGALRLVDNSSLRFRDVRLNNLVVTGTIQGLDLSRDALLRTDNLNGTHDSNIRAQQILMNNQRIFDHLYQTRPTFKVQTNHQNETFAGMCHIHSCPPTTKTIVQQTQNYMLPKPLAMVAPQVKQFGPQGPQVGPQPPQVGPVWRPVQVPVHMAKQNNALALATPAPIGGPHDQLFGLTDPKYIEYQAHLKSQAIKDLTARVNRYLSFSFYYEIAQKHPLLGPVLHAASNPIPNESGSAWLLLKAASKRGEPCLHRGQKIDVMSQQRNKGAYSPFTVSSRIQDTSSPSIVESLVVGSNYYVFVVDIHPDGAVSETTSQVLVYLWDYKMGMYDLRQRIVIDGFPTALKAFVVNKFACIALANPSVVQSNHSGAPLLYCQQAPITEFNQRIILPMHNIFDLDIYTLPSSSRIIVAALSQQHTEQVGDLIVNEFDMVTRTLINIAMRRTARPLKLHFIKQLSRKIQLVVSEGITSNDAAQATTRIFTLQPEGHLVENQIIKDNQFTDIQSVVLDGEHSMLFLKSTHSISIYAPIKGTDCQLSLIQRLPLKGANRFLVFNTNVTHPQAPAPTLPYRHILVLSKDDCEHQQYSTVILRPNFG